MKSTAGAEIRERVTMTEAAEAYGFRPNRAGYIRCPFHDEKTPSLKLYRDSWYCFGCQSGGDLVAFVRKYFGLSFPDAVSKINDDFRLGLNLNRRAGPPSPEALERIRERRERENRRIALVDELERLTKLYQFYHECTRLYEPVVVPEGSVEGGDSVEGGVWSLELSKPAVNAADVGSASLPCSACSDSRDRKVTPHSTLQTPHSADSTLYINPCLAEAWRELPALEDRLDELARLIAQYGK